MRIDRQKRHHNPHAGYRGKDRKEKGGENEFIQFLHDKSRMTPPSYHRICVGTRNFLRICYGEDFEKILWAWSAITARIRETKEGEWRRGVGRRSVGRPWACCHPLRYRFISCRHFLLLHGRMGRQSAFMRPGCCFPPWGVVSPIRTRRKSKSSRCLIRSVRAAKGISAQSVCVPGTTVRSAGFALRTSFSACSP